MSGIVFPIIFGGGKGNSGQGAVTSVEKNPFTETIEIGNIFQHSPNYTATPSATLNIIKGTASVIINGVYIIKMILDNNTLNHSVSFDTVGNYNALTGVFLLRYTLQPDGNILVEIFNASEAPPIVLPTVTTQAVTDIAETTATGNGEVTDEGGTIVTERGIVWSENPSPTLADNSAIGGSGIGVYTALITGTTGGVTYYVRTYATNIAGTSYGNEVTYVSGQDFVQLLSSLTVDTEGIPTGLVDEIDGNNTLYLESPAYQGTGGVNSLRVTYPASVDLYAQGEDVISFVSYVERNQIVTTNNIPWSFRDESQQVAQLQKTTGGNMFVFAFRDSSGVFSQILSIGNIYPDTFAKVECRIEGISNGAGGTVTLKLLINNVEEASTTYTRGATLESTIFTISNYTTNGNPGPNGFLDRLADVQILFGATKFGRYPLSEGKFDTDGDIAYDVINGNDAVLINAGANDAVQDIFHYSQKGYLPKNGVNIPIKEDLSEFADGTAIGTDANEVLQDGLSMLASAKLIQPPVVDLIINDVDEVYFNAGIPKQTTVAEIEAAIIANPSIYTGDVVTGKSIKNIGLKPTPFAASTAVVSFIFDDRNATDADVKGVFDEFGLKPNFAIMSQGLSAVNAPFYKQCFDDGCSILAHGIISTNKLDGTAGLTDEQAREEIQDCKPVIESYGIDVSGFVTPYSVMHPDYLPYLDGHYDYAFTDNNAGLWDETVNPKHLERYSLEENIDLEDHNINVITARIDSAIANNELLTIYGHQLPSLHLDNHGQSRLNADDLRAILTYCMGKIANRTLRVLSADEAIVHYYQQ